MIIGPGEARSQVGNTQLPKLINRLFDVLIFLEMKPFQNSQSWMIGGVISQRILLHDFSISVNICPFIVRPRANNSELALFTWSFDVCPRSHSHNSVSPSMKFTSGVNPKICRDLLISA